MNAGEVEGRKMTPFGNFAGAFNEVSPGKRQIKRVQAFGSPPLPFYLPANIIYRSRRATIELDWNEFDEESCQH